MIDKYNDGMDKFRSRRDAFLYVNKSQAIDEYWLWPFGRVRPDIAAKIIAHPKVYPCNDGMFGTSQTYRMVGV
jgi:hypothetical protein